MQKVLVIGCCGAGKSTFSKKLQSILNVGLIHLDQYYHKPNWEEPKKEEWERIVNNLIKKPSWIKDGTYIESLDIRIEKCDTLIYLDYSILKCFFRVVKSIFTDYGKKRSDMAPGCKEEFDLEFLKYVLTFNFKNRNNILKRLKVLNENKQLYIFKNDKQADKFLKQVEIN
ncbi:MAG: hypothetical protein HOH88_04275 [Flavobacteriales bacterium]|nr:hypothetical protein [Flavobacteriales bacterium]